MMRHRPVTIRRISRRGRIAQAGLGLAILAATLIHSPVVAGDIESNVAMYVSAREILFGVDPARRAVLAEAARRLADVPRGADWVALNRRGLDRWIAEPWSACIYRS